MAKSEYVNVFDLEGSYAGGGDFFKAGRYSVEEGGAFFTMFDFNGKADEPVPALCLELQPRDAAGKKVGDTVPQFWPIRGSGVEVALPIKGQKGAFASLKMTGDYDTLFKGGEFFTFMTFLRKAEFDMDQYDGDITVLGGALDGNFDKTPDPYDVEKRKNGGGAAKEGKKDYGPRMIVVVTELVKAAKGKAAGKPKATEEATEEKPAAGKGKAGKGKAAATAQELVAEYIESEMDGAKEKEPTTRPLMRMSIAKWLKDDKGSDGDMVKEVQDLVNDDDELKSVLKTFGWTLKGREIHPPAED